MSGKRIIVKIAFDLANDRGASDIQGETEDLGRFVIDSIEEAFNQGLCPDIIEPSVVKVTGYEVQEDLF